MPKIFLVFLIIVIIALLGLGGYFIARYYLGNSGPAYLFMHPTISKIFNLTPVCSTVCLPQGICGNDGKNYCNQCVAFQHQAGYAYDGACHPVGWKIYDNFGIYFQYPQAWASPEDGINGIYQQATFNINSSVSPLSVSIQPFLNPLTGITETLDQMMDRYIANNKNINSISDISVNGIKGKEILTNSAANGKPYFFEADFSLNTNSYVSFSGDITSITQDTFNKIISTFKTDNSTQIQKDLTSGMSVYKNNSITFEYPEKLNSDYISLNLQIIILNKLDSKINSKGCYSASSASGKPSPSQSVTVNNLKFCLTTGNDVGAGQAYNSYYYTTLNNGEYYVIDYAVHSPNACGGYENSANVNAPGNEQYKACLADEKNWDNIVVKPIQNSIATFKLTN